VNTEALKAIQDPLKAHYREEPEAAVVTLRAQGTLGEGVSCSVATGRAIAEAGLHPATGGDGSLLCSGDMLLEALAACAGDAPVGFRAIRMRFVLDSDASDDELDTLLKLTERYCVVYQTLAHAPELSITRARQDA